MAGCDNDSPTRTQETLQLSLCPRDVGAPPPVVNGAECGELEVPLDPNHPDGETITLAIKRWPAISAVAEPDPVFVIAGGPGQSAIEVSDRLGPSFFNLRKKRDIVFVDQRGTGQSAPLNCELEQNLSLSQLSADTEAHTLKQLKQCAETHKQRAPFVLTPYAIDDLESVRQALGYAHINLWGGSYGTRVALRYMARYPQALRSVVLDGLAPVSLSVPYRMGESANAALQTLADQCLADAKCGGRYGNIEAIAENLAQTLSRQPVELSIEHPLTGSPQQVLLDADKLAAIVRLALYDRLSARLIPYTLFAAGQGDYQPLASLVSQFLAPEHTMNIAMGMHLSILCNEDTGVRPLPERATFLTVDLAEVMLQACEFWPRAPLPADYYQPVASSVPALLLSGAADPVTPPKWGEQVAASLTQATHLVAPGGHHGITTQSCAAGVVTDFIRDLAVSDKSRQCIESIRPMPAYRDGVWTGENRDD
nr:alpha/beta fold hydrolase [Gilvimarinus xylanilyticus]